MIRSFRAYEPQIAESAYVDPSAIVIGDVVLETDVTVLPQAVLRGDAGQIVVGKRSNVQDGAILHEHAVLGEEVTVGHQAIVHDATVAAGALIGMQATVLDGATIGEGAVVAAGAVVTEGTTVPRETLVAGIPAEEKGEVSGTPGAVSASHYVELGRSYAEEAATDG